MPSLSLSARLIWFAHCPKAGGTSVEQLMVARWGRDVGHLHWGWDLWWRRGGWRVADPPNSPQHLVWSDAEKLLSRRPDAVFALVRDPAARMASEYRWQRRHRRGTRLGRMLSYLPFWLWLRIMLGVARQNPHAFDNHFRPQSDFVPAQAEVFRLEDGLAPVVAWLSEKTGEQVADNEIPHAIPSGRRQVCPSKCLCLIAKVFAEDYARFGYPPPPVSKPVKGPRETGLSLVISLVAWLERRGRI